MKKTVKVLSMLLLAFAVIFCISRGAAEPVSAFEATKVTGGATRATAREILTSYNWVSNDYVVSLSGKQAVYFKFQTQDAFSGRKCTRLRILRDETTYSGVFYAFFGSAERLDKKDHTRWSSKTYTDGKYPILFCTPGNVYYLWICGGNDQASGKITFRVTSYDDDSDDLDKEEATPISLSKKTKASIDSDESSSYLTDIDWFSFKTGQAGKYIVTTAVEKRELSWDEDCVSPFDLKVEVYDSSLNRVNGYQLSQGETKKGSFVLKEKTTYFLKMTPVNFYAEKYLEALKAEEGKDTVPEEEGDSYDEWDEEPDQPWDDPDMEPYLLEKYSFRIDAVKDISKEKLTVSFTKDWTYTGKAIKPTVKVVCGGKTLTKGTDYTVSYSGNTAPGKGKITIKGKGIYTGSRSCSFVIRPKKQVISSLTSTIAGKATVKIRKDSTISGYQLSYSLTSDFKKSKTATTTATSKSFTLTSGRIYYFRVRGIAKNGTSKIYGAWSAVKKVKVG